MSLANDANLIEQLLRLAQAAPQAQTPAPTGVTPAARAIAQKLISNLKQESVKPASAFTSDKGDLDLKDPKVLKSLQVFLEYLRTNIIRNNGYSLVVLPEEDGKLSPVYQKYNIYYPFPKSAAQSPKYFVYKDGLLAFVRELQRQVGAENTFVNSLLANLISEINSDFTDMKAEDEDENKKTNETNVRIDMLPKPMSTARPYELGDNELTTKNLSSQTEFASFFKDIPMEDQGKTLTMGQDPPEYVRQVIAYLNKRAAAFSVYGREQDKAYVIAMRKLSALYPGQAASPAQANQPAQATPQQTALLQSSIPWPLFPDKIDLDQIGKFLSWYITFNESGSNASAKATAESYKNYQGMVSTFMTTYPGLHTQLLGSEGISQIKSSIFAKSSGRETSVQKYVESLQTIVGGVYSALGHLETVFQGFNGANFKDYVSYIQSQKAAYQRNLDHLERLQQQAEDDFRNIQRQNKG